MSHCEESFDSAFRTLCFYALQLRSVVNVNMVNKVSLTNLPDGFVGLNAPISPVQLVCGTSWTIDQLHDGESPVVRKIRCQVCRMLLCGTQP